MKKYQISTISWLINYETISRHKEERIERLKGVAGILALTLLIVIILLIGGILQGGYGL